MNRITVKRVWQNCILYKEAKYNILVTSWPKNIFLKSWIYKKTGIMFA